jgi:hypothetical protein
MALMFYGKHPAANEVCPRDSTGTQQGQRASSTRPLLLHINLTAFPHELWGNALVCFPTTFEER